MDNSRQQSRICHVSTQQQRPHVAAAKCQEPQTNLSVFRAVNNHKLRHQSITRLNHSCLWGSHDADISSGGCWMYANTLLGGLSSLQDGDYQMRPETFRKNTTVCMFTGNWRFFVVRRGMFVSVAYCLKPQGWNNQKVVWIFHAGLFPHQARTFFIPTGDKGRQEAFRVFLQLQNYWGVTQLQSLGQSMHAHTHTMQAYSTKSGFAVCLTLPNSLRIQLDANRVILREKILPRTGIVSRL